MTSGILDIFKPFLPWINCGKDHPRDVPAYSKGTEPMNTAVKTNYLTTLKAQFGNRAGELLSFSNNSRKLFDEIKANAAQPQNFYTALIDHDLRGRLQYEISAMTASLTPFDGGQRAKRMETLQLLAECWLENAEACEGLIAGHREAENARHYQSQYKTAPNAHLGLGGRV